MTTRISASAASPLSIATSVIARLLIFFRRRRTILLSLQVDLQWTSLADLHNLTKAKNRELKLKLIRGALLLYLFTVYFFAPLPLQPFQSPSMTRS